MREGGVEAPTQRIEWKTEEFWDRDSLNEELLRYVTSVTAADAVSVCAIHFHPLRSYRRVRNA